MANFLGVLIKSIKNHESVKHQFMGEYGVVISIFKDGDLVWVESTWGMGLKELRKVVQWGGGRFTSKSVPLEDRNKRNIDLDKKTLMSVLLSWETEELGLCEKLHEPNQQIEPGLAQVLHDSVPGQILQKHESVTGASVNQALKELSQGKTTGFIRVSGRASALIFVVRGRPAAAMAVKDQEVLFGQKALNWLAQQVDLELEIIKGDLFTSTCYAGPMLPHRKAQANPDDLEDIIKKTQGDINGLYLIHITVNQAHAFGMIYRQVYAGTVAKKKGETTGSILPLAVLLRLAMLPGANMEIYRMQVPIDGPSKPD